MVAIMVSTEMSVRNPRRPWFTPTSATSCGASVRAMFSMVPSPPMTMARSACRPISSSASAGYRVSFTWDAVRRSIRTRTLRPSR